MPIYLLRRAASLLYAIQILNIFVLVKVYYRNYSLLCLDPQPTSLPAITCTYFMPQQCAGSSNQTPRQKHHKESRVPPCEVTCGSSAVAACSALPSAFRHQQPEVTMANSSRFTGLPTTESVPLYTD